MLTPIQIKNHEFEIAGKNAYSMASVNDFMKQIHESYEQMFRENGELYKKAMALAEKLEAFKKDESSIQNALIAAQRASNDILNQAHADADAIIAEANTKAEEIIERAIHDSVTAAEKAEQERIEKENQMTEIQKMFNEFQANIVANYVEQIKAINEISAPYIEKTEIEESEDEIAPEFNEAIEEIANEELEKDFAERFSEEHSTEEILTANNDVPNDTIIELPKMDEDIDEDVMRILNSAAKGENKLTGIDALMAQDLGPNATVDDCNKLLQPGAEAFGIGKSNTDISDTGE